MARIMPWRPVIGRRRVVGPRTESNPKWNSSGAKINSAIIPVGVVVHYNGSSRNAGAKINQRRPRSIHVGWRRIINKAGIVLRHIDHLRIGWHDLDDGVGDINDLSIQGSFNDRLIHADYLLGRGLERPGGLRFGAQGLNSIHHLQRLLSKILTQSDGPTQIIIHLLNDRWKPSGCLDVGVPRLIIKSSGVVIVGHEARGIDNARRKS